MGKKPISYRQRWEKIWAISVLKLASVAQLDARPTGDQVVDEIDHEIFSTVILCLPLIQEG